MPVPAVGLAGQALIISEAGSTNIFLVALIGGLAMTLAEITAYVAGIGGRALTTDRSIPIPRRLENLVNRSVDLVNKSMQRWGIPTLFVLSIIPNPVFEFAGIAAGATRMKFWHFIVPVGLGKTGRAFILATVGDVFF